jgi:tetratricopeptide (TPR) repeat protein
LQADIDARKNALFEELIGRYQQALKRDPNLDQARLGLAKNLQSSHLYAEAASEYAKYMARQPGDPQGYLGAGQNALEMHDDQAAQTLLERAYSLAPHDSEILAAKALLELHRGQLPQALSFFDQSIKADPFDDWNHYQRMLLLMRLGRKSEADLERQTIERLKRERARFGEISDALRENPLDPQLRSEAARWLMDHGHEEEAIDWANLVLQSDASHPEMNRMLADFYGKKGQLGLANFYKTQIARPADHSTGATP